VDYKTSPIKFKHLRHVISTPFILGMAIPAVFFDACLELYHRVTFPLYGLPFVKRSNHIIFDRHKLDYLNLMDKCWCTYCAYVNGLLAYGVEIGGCTEKYWCAIKHEKYAADCQPKHHDDFLPYADEGAFQENTKSH
jgi:hypothetical protein